MAEADKNEASATDRLIEHTTTGATGAPPPAAGANGIPSGQNPGGMAPGGGPGAGLGSLGTGGASTGGSPTGAVKRGGR
jgi:hypothetical protein